MQYLMQLHRIKHDAENKELAQPTDEPVITFSRHVILYVILGVG